MGSVTIDGGALASRRDAERSGAPAGTSSATVPPDDEEQAGGVGLAACAIATVAVAAVAVYQANAGNSWSPPFFFDEMWRVDFIRSTHPIDRMLTHDTPIAPGWVGLLHVVTAPTSQAPIVFRAFSAGFFLAGVAVLTILFVRILQRRPLGFERLRWRPHSLPIPVLAAPMGVALAMFVPLVTIYTQWFNNYTFEILYVALLVLAAEELDRTPRWAFPAVCVLLGLAPLFVIGGLLALPAVVVCVGWWAVRTDPARRVPRLGGLAAGCVVAAASALVIWTKIYKPVSAKPSIAGYWIEYGASLGGAEGPGELLTKSFTQLSAGLIGDRLYFADGWVRWGAYAVLLASVVVGLATIGRRWGWLLGAIGSAWVLSVVASAVIHWPMTIERVNLCWQILFFAVVGVGLARSVLWCVGRHTWLGIGVLALAFPLLWFPPYDVHIDTFNRNVVGDLRYVVDQAGPHNLVFQYNALTAFYADDAFNNSAHPGRTFDLRSEGNEDPNEPLLRPLDPLVAAAGLRSGDMVWCVIPGETGDKIDQACRFTDPSNLELVNQQQGRDALMYGFRVR